jgi:hypothetical protein
MSVEEIARSLSDNARKLLPHMSDGELVRPAAYMAEEAEMSVADTRAAIAEIRLLGLTTTGPLYDLDDGTLKGRGTWLNREGLAVRASLSKESE